MLTKEQTLFLKLIREGLQPSPSPLREVKEATRKELQYCFVESSRQSLRPILYNGLEASVSAGATEAEEWLDLISADEVPRTMSAYKLYKECDHVIGELKKEGIPVVMLKGATLGALYEMPEYRKSGDIDLFLQEETDVKRAAEVMQRLGYHQDEDSDCDYHVGFRIRRGPEVELHTKLTGEFPEKRLNQAVKRFTERMRKKAAGEVSVLGFYTFPTFQGADLIYYNLLHMLHHFTTKGFGWKFICDWSMMFKNGLKKEEQRVLYRRLEESRLLDFAEAVSLLSVKYLGLQKDHVEFLLSGEIPEGIIDQMAEELFDAGELGTGDQSRMLRAEDSSLAGMVKLFHTQMKRNFPGGSKVILLWPLLWLLTLVKFIYNNRFLRHVSTLDVIKSAGKRGGGKNRLKLYRR